MRILLLIAAFLTLAPVAAHVAMAQVIVDRAALDQLAGIAPPPVAVPRAIPAPPIRPRPRRAAYRRVLARRPVAPPVVAAGRVAPPPGRPPEAGPPAATVRPAAARQPVPVRPAAPAAVRIAFAAGAADLPAGAVAALHPFCAHPGGGLTIDAHAPAIPGQPSGAARLSMARAFAIRDALIACGVAPTAILPRADGAAKLDPDAATIAAGP